MPVTNTADIEQMSKLNNQFYIVTDDKRISELAAAGIAFKELHAVDDFHVSMLTLPFINPATRSKALSRFILVQVN